MKEKIPPATAFLPNRKKDVVQMNPRVPRELFDQVTQAADQLSITTQDFCEGALRRYLEELRVEGVIK